MSRNKKLKPIAISMVILLHVLILSAFIIVRIIYGADTVFLISAVINLVCAFWGLFLALRTKNSFFVILFLFFLFLMIANSVRVFYSESVAEYFLFVAILFGIWMFYILFTKKVKYRGREILELAAKPINETADGFTTRPYVSGKVEYAHTEIKDFSQFLLKHLIALPYFKEERVVHLLEYKLSHLLYFRNDYEYLTHITFEKEGNIIVYISKKFYSKYKDELTFDQLCKSFGDLFKEFFVMHKRGEGKNIIKRMNALKEFF